MKLNTTTDYKNLPRQELMKDITVAFASYDIPKAMSYMDDGIQWTLAGEAPIVGKAQFEAALQENLHNKVKELTIHSILTQGTEAAINGEMLMEDGTVFGFSDFYKFMNETDAIVKSIVSYVLVIQREPVAQL